MISLNMVDHPVIPLTVHLDLEHLPNTQGYLGLLLSHVLPPRPSKSYRVVDPESMLGARVYVVAHEILVSAHCPLIFGTKGLGPGLDN